MDRARKWYIALSIFLTAVFVALGVTIFQRSFMRFWETLGDLLSSCKFYGCEIFEIEHTTCVSVIEKSEVLKTMKGMSGNAFCATSGLWKRF